MSFEHGYEDSAEPQRAAQYSDLFESHHDHGADCALCPICATLGVLRRTRPEVVEHLASAARELVAAASILVEEAERVVGAPEPAASKDSADRVRRIDIA